MEQVEISVARLEDVPERGMRAVQAGKQPLLVCRIDDHVFTVRAFCPHRGAPLVEGKLEGALLRCPWHGARFDVRTGARVCVPQCKDLRIFPSRVTDGQITVTLASAEAG